MPTTFASLDLDTLAGVSGGYEKLPAFCTDVRNNTPAYKNLPESRKRLMRMFCAERYGDDWR